MMLIRPKDMAAKLGVSISFLRNSDCPKVFVPGGRGQRMLPRYDEVKVMEWIANRQPKKQAS